MINSAAAADFSTTKQENSSSSNTSTTTTTTTSTTSWSRLKDPRIVRVSGAHGGKDRHSKVCTVRGLRDRRVRLSVHTAIQLYDLQDRLGLNQPSKVVDWLLNAAKNEIDELPPLQIPQGGFLINQNLDHHHRQHEFIASQSDERGLIKNIRNDEGSSRQLFNLSENQGDDIIQLNSINPSCANLPINYNSFVRWDPLSNLALSHHHPPRTLIGSMTTGDHQNQDLQNFSLTNPSLGSHHHQVLVCQPGLINTQNYINFPSGLSNSPSTSSLNSPLSLDHHSTSTDQPVIRPFHNFSMSDANLNLPLQNNNAENEKN